MVSLSLVDRLHTVGSLRNSDVDPAYRVKNRLFDAVLVAVKNITIDGVAFDRSPRSTGSVRTSNTVGTDKACRCN